MRRFNKGKITDAQRKKRTARAQRRIKDLKKIKDDRKKKKENADDEFY